MRFLKRLLSLIFKIFPSQKFNFSISSDRGGFLTEFSYDTALRENILVVDVIDLYFVQISPWETMISHFTIVNFF